MNDNNRKIESFLTENSAVNASISKMASPERSKKRKTGLSYGPADISILIFYHPSIIFFKGDLLMNLAKLTKQQSKSSLENTGDKESSIYNTKDNLLHSNSLFISVLRIAVCHGFMCF